MLRNIQKNGKTTKVRNVYLLTKKKQQIMVTPDFSGQDIDLFSNNDRTMLMTYMLGAHRFNSEIIGVCLRQTTYKGEEDEEPKVEIIFQHIRRGYID